MTRDEYEDRELKRQGVTREPGLTRNRVTCIISMVVESARGSP